MKKILYKNLTFGGNLITIALEDKYEKNIEAWVFNNCHRYRGNKILGHGIGEYSVYDTNRDTDENIKHNLDYHRAEIEKHSKAIDELTKKMKEPYTEKFLYEKKIGALPIKEELLAEGWTNDQIDTAFLRINM